MDRFTDTLVSPPSAIGSLIGGSPLVLLWVAMQGGQLSDAQPFAVILRNMRIYQGKTGIWTEFKEQ